MPSPVPRPTAPPATQRPGTCQPPGSSPPAQPNPFASPPEPAHFDDTRQHLRGVRPSPDRRRGRRPSSRLNAGLPRVAVGHARQTREDAWVGTKRAILDLPEGRQLLLERGERTATFTGLPLSHDELVHPYLGAAACITNRWAGREVYHAGAFTSGGLAWVVVGAREAGKSSLLAELASRRIPVLADDLVVTDGHQVFCGHGPSIFAGPGPRHGAGDAGPGATGGVSRSLHCPARCRLGDGSTWTGATTWPWPPCRRLPRWPAWRPGESGPSCPRIQRRCLPSRSVPDGILGARLTGPGWTRPRRDAADALPFPRSSGRSGSRQVALAHPSRKCVTSRSAVSDVSPKQMMSARVSSWAVVQFPSRSHSNAAEALSAW